jgi:hypothetical protein
MSHSWVEVLTSYVLLFGVVFLARCDFAIDPTASVHQMLCKSRKKCDEDFGNDYKSFQRRRHEPYTDSKNSPRSKDRDRRKKIESMLIISLTSRKNSLW